MINDNRSYLIIMIIITIGLYLIIITVVVER